MDINSSKAKLLCFVAVAAFLCRFFSKVQYSVGLISVDVFSAKTVFTFCWSNTCWFFRYSDDVIEPFGGLFAAVDTGGSLVAFSLWMELWLHPPGAVSNGQNICFELLECRPNQNQIDSCLCLELIRFCAKARKQVFLRSVPSNSPEWIRTRETFGRVTSPRVIHPASRGVAAHTAVVLRQLQGPEMGFGVCGHGSKTT